MFKVGIVVDNVTRHVWPLSNVKRWKVKVTMSRNVTYQRQNDRTRQRMVLSTSKLVEIINMGAKSMTFLGHWAK